MRSNALLNSSVVYAFENFYIFGMCPSNFCVYCIILEHFGDGQLGLLLRFVIFLGRALGGGGYFYPSAAKSPITRLAINKK